MQADEYQQMAQGSYTSVQTIDAARGEILDRYGRPLAVNEVSYDIMINEAYLPNDMKNTVIERIILLMEQEGQTWIDTLPISTTEPFTPRASKISWSRSRPKTGSTWTLTPRPRWKTSWRNMTLTRWRTR